jgi:hypothetical protein
MIIEIRVPDEWPPELGFTVARLLRQAVSTGFPIIATVRSDATAEEVGVAYDRVREVIAQAGLTA